VAIGPAQPGSGWSGTVAHENGATKSVTPRG